LTRPLVVQHVPRQEYTSLDFLLLFSLRQVCLFLLNTMGQFVWNEWAHLVSITASVYSVWSAYFGLFYRKVFWDFVGGHLRAPGGLQPSSAIIPLAKVIVNVPLIQIIAFLMGILMLAIELPLPLPPFSGLHARLGWVPRIPLLLFQAVFTVLYYQGTNAALWSLIAAFGYAMAEMNGEKSGQNDKARPGSRGKSAA